MLVTDVDEKATSFLSRAEAVQGCGGHAPGRRAGDRGRRRATTLTLRASQSTAVMK